MDHNDLEFFIPSDTDTYIDLDIKLYFRGKWVSGVGKNVDLTDTTSYPIISSTNFSVSVTALNGVAVTHLIEHYNYRSCLGTDLTYGTDAAASNLINSYRYLDSGDMRPYGQSVENQKANTNEGIIPRWTRLSVNNVVQLSPDYLPIYVTWRYFSCLASGCI